MSEPMNIDGDEPKKIDGRSKEARALRAAQRARGPVREQIAEPVREAVRERIKDGEFVGRDGEVLSRQRINGVDEYDFPREIIPEGWDYQWNTVSIYNNTDLTLNTSNQMYRNGFRAVPAERHPGVFLPRGKTGEIVIKGVRLEERPLAMSKQAHLEDQKAAIQQMRDRDQALMGGKANMRNMPAGFEMGGKYRGTGGDLKMSIDHALDVPAANYKVAESGE